MPKWLKRIRGAIGMGLTWALGWGLSGILIGVASKLFPWLPFWDTFFNVFDAPLPALAVPGFFGGVFFSIVLGIAGRRHRFSELSVRSFALWGALGGVLLSLFPVSLVAAGLASANRPIWELLTVTAVASVPIILLSSGFAAGYLTIARRAEQREVVDSLASRP